MVTVIRFLYYMVQLLYYKFNISFGDTLLHLYAPQRYLKLHSVSVFPTKQIQFIDARSHSKTFGCLDTAKQNILLSFLVSWDGTV